MNAQQVNGRAPVVNINPQQAAALALKYYKRASMTGDEREEYGIGEALLNAIASGSVVLNAPPAPSVELPGEPEPTQPGASN